MAERPGGRVRRASGDEATSGQDVQALADRFTQLEANVATVVEGKAEVVRLALIALLAEGHLIEDVPGVGKTLLAKATSRSIASSVRRIQFTPDLLPRHHRRDRLQPGARRLRAQAGRGFAVLDVHSRHTR